MIAPLPSLAVFRDIPLKLQLPPDLERDIRAFADRPQGALTPAEWPSYVEAGLSIAERCVAYCDAEVARLTEQRFSMPDPNALKQKLVGDARRQVDQLLQQMRAKLGSEKQEWARRVAKQMSEVATTIDQQIETLTMDRSEDPHAIVLRPNEEWFREFNRWKTAVFEKWAGHLSPLLQSKTLQLLQPDLDALRDALGEPVVVKLPLPQAMPLPLGRAEPKDYGERVEVPTPMETFFELFKGNLATVAMIAGMVIVPVAGEFMNQAATHVRAIIMGAMVAPIVAFAAWQAGKLRRKTITGGEEKALDKIRKAIAADSKAELERFKPDAERFSAAYCGTAQTTALGVIEPIVARAFEKREQRVAADLAKAHLAGERLNETAGVLRQVRTALTGQVVVDLRRRQLELASPPQEMRAPPATPAKA